LREGPFWSQKRIANRFRIADFEWRIENAANPQSSIRNLQFPMPRFSVHLLPSLTSPDELAGATVVVLDILRATTTIVHALAAGAKEVIPCLEIDEARAKHAALPTGTAILGGERKGTRIEGFDLGNSPDEYTSATVGDKTLVFTTTNGTRAMQQCRLAQRVLIGALVNAQSVAKALSQSERIHIICAGTDGQITSEDVLAAGIIFAEWRHLTACNDRHQWNDDAELALALACTVSGQPLTTLATLSAAQSDAIARELLASRGGQNLYGVGLQKDIHAAARLNRFSLVPKLNLSDWTITIP
jgi:2-phosphosulfolactate phosphatase